MSEETLHTEMLYLSDVHKYLGKELHELFYQYEKLYGITDMYYNLARRDDQTIIATIGMAPIVYGTEDRAGRIEAKVLLPVKDIEDEHTARYYIPEIHKAFIKEMHYRLRQRLIHSYDMAKSAKIKR